MQAAASLLGRILLSAIFLLSGFNKIGSWDSTAAYMATHGMPLVSFFLLGAIFLELVGGTMVLIGYYTKLGALLLLLFLLPATFIFHAFWAVPEAMVKLQMIMFLKNLAIMGGLLHLYATGPGRLSLDQ